MVIPSDLLEHICKNTIETIFLCLDYATKGTIYSIGPVPDLLAVRVTSGVRESTGVIRWGLPGTSDYNPPGKVWEAYRDQPGRPLEAMGWCVEKQKSWTADNPGEDSRSVRKQLLGETEDFHHMEPVLVSRRDLYGERLHMLPWPVDWYGEPIWQDNDFAVVAVIKIHFRPNTIKRGDRSTKIIKKLSRTLGTEMLSLHLRESLLQSQKDLTRHRLDSCNILAHELRNTLMKLGFAFSAINAEISFLREQWEVELRKTFPNLPNKRLILERLNELIGLRLHRVDTSDELADLANLLMSEAQELSALSLLPHQEELWFKEKILPKWHRLLTEAEAWKADREEITRLLEDLQQAFWVGMNRSLAQKVLHLPEELRTTWPALVYSRFSPDKLHLLDDLLKLLEHPALDIPHKHHTQKVFTSLRALVRIIPEVEQRANIIISCLKNGSCAELL